LNGDRRPTPILSGMSYITFQTKCGIASKNALKNLQRKRARGFCLESDLQRKRAREFCLECHTPFSRQNDEHVAQTQIGEIKNPHLSVRVSRSGKLFNHSLNPHSLFSLGKTIRISSSVSYTLT